VTYADKWLLDEDWRDPDTGMQYSRDALNTELEKIEKPAGISNPKDFRNEVVNFVLRRRAHGKNPHWTSYEKLRVVIEKRMFSKTEDILPIISFEARARRKWRSATRASSTGWPRAAIPRSRCAAWSTGTCTSRNRRSS